MKERKLYLQLYSVHVDNKHNIHWPWHLNLDLHWTLTVFVLFQKDLSMRLDVEVSSDSRGSTQVCIVDYNIIEILRIF